MPILLHSCCGPCLGGSYPVLEQAVGSGNTAVLWDNPNIHPFVEYNQRLDSFKKMASIFALEVFFGDASYGLEKFLGKLDGNFGPDRCAICYHLRLSATAKVAVANSFSAFTTTLLISPYQDHELLIRTGQEIGQEFGIKFHYSDFRQGFKNTHEMARQHELYRQKYCGCIFSEHERYKNDRKFLNPQTIPGVKINEPNRRDNQLED